MDVNVCLELVLVEDPDLDIEVKVDLNVVFYWGRSLRLLDVVPASNPVLKLDGKRDPDWRLNLMRERELELDMHEMDSRRELDRRHSLEGSGIEMESEQQNRK